MRLILSPSICLLHVCLFIFLFEDNDKYASTWSKTGDDGVVTNEPPRMAQYPNGPGQVQSQDSGAMIQKIVGDEREDEMEQNLNLVRHFSSKNDRLGITLF